MTDEELIAEMRRAGAGYRSRDGIADKHVGWLLREAAGRLDGRAAAQATEDTMADRKTCEFCNAPAVWRSKPESRLLCDSHAAYEDLDQLEDLMSPPDVPRA